MIGGANLVRELCVALEHRWSPESLFLIFTAYFDESGTHGPAPTVIMGGFLGHAYQWRIFNRDLDRLRADYGFRLFHAKKFKHKRGEFEGWSDEKCRQLVKDLAMLVNADLTEGVTVSLERSRYLNEYRNLPFPSKMQPDSQYGLCFRVCLGHFWEMVCARGGKRPKLHIVIEDGHENVGGALVIFSELKKWMARRDLDVLGKIIIAKKDESDELMAADFLAHTYSMMCADNPVFLDGLPNQDAPNARPRGEAGLTYLEFKNETFQEFKDIFERERQASIDDWRAKRDAKKVSLASSGRRPS